MTTTGVLELATQLQQLATELQEGKTKVQSVICSKKRFKTALAAAKWCRDHGFKAGKADTTSTSYRFRQFEPSSCQVGSFRTLKLDTGVSAVICRPK